MSPGAPVKRARASYMKSQKPSERIAELLHEMVGVLQRRETTPDSPVETFVPSKTRRPRYEWITSCRSSIATNCSIFFARVSALFTVWIRNRMANRFALFRVAKNAFASGWASSAR